MRGLCPGCGKLLPIFGTRGQEGSNFYVVRRRCDRCKLTVTEETTFELDEVPEHAPRKSEQR